MKLVFIPGAGNTGFAWRYQTEHFPDSEAVSLPGHPEGKPCASVDDYTNWLHQYILARGYSELILVGHSMGGAVAQTYALSYPEGVKGLVLIGTGARLRVSPEFLRLLDGGSSHSPDWFKDFIEPLYSRVAPDFRKVVIEKVVEVGAGVQLNDFRCCDKFDIMDKIYQIKTPTLVICGSEDEMTPVKYSQYLATKINGARLVIIEGGTHLAFMEKPEEVNRAIKEFVRGI